MAVAIITVVNDKLVSVENIRLNIDELINKMRIYIYFFEYYCSFDLKNYYLKDYPKEGSR